MSDIVALPQQTESEIATLNADGEVALHHDGSPPEVMRERIQALVRRMFDVPGAITEFPDDDVLEGGMYLRRIFIPKGQMLAGKIHLQTCMNIVASGDITVLTEFGCRRLKAGYVGASRPGIQKIGVAHEDTIFINVFRTDETDMEKIEAQLVCTSHDQIKTRMETLWPGDL